MIASNGSFAAALSFPCFSLPAPIGTDQKVFAPLTASSTE